MPLRSTALDGAALDPEQRDTPNRTALVRPTSLRLRLVPRCSRQGSATAIQPRSPVRIIVLKARQLGISTVTAGIMYNWTFLHPGIRSLVIAHETEASKNLFDKAKLMWEEWPYQLALHRIAQLPEDSRLGTDTILDPCRHRPQHRLWSIVHLSCRPRSEALFGKNPKL